VFADAKCAAELFLRAPGVAASWPRATREATLSASGRVLAPLEAACLREGARVEPDLRCLK